MREPVAFHDALVSFAERRDIIMKKIITEGFMIIGYFIFSLCFGIYEAFKYLFMGTSWKIKIALLGSFICLIVLGIFNPTIFLILISIIGSIVFLFAVYLVKGNVGDTSNKYEYDNAKESKFLFFDGMTYAEAKKEYRRLMKKYHPDNENGDLEMSQKISTEYDQYCTMCGV